MKAVFRIVLQGTPDNLSEDSIRVLVKSFPEVTDTHDIHVWSMDGNYHIVTLHVVVGDNLPVTKQEELKKKIKASLEKLSIQHVTLEIETEGFECAASTGSA